VIEGCPYSLIGLAWWVLNRATNITVSVLYQINTTATKTLQLFLHSAALLIMRKFERITPTLRDDLHWLPVRERIVFKLLLDHLQTSSVATRHQTAPQYLQELCVPATANTSRRHALTFCRSWRFSSASLPHFQFWTTQLRYLCSKTVELSATVTSGSNTYTDIIPPSHSYRLSLQLMDVWRGIT